MKIQIKSPLKSNFEINQILNRLKTEFTLSKEVFDELEKAIRNTNGSYVSEENLETLKSVFEFELYDDYWQKELNTEKEANIWYETLTDREKEYANSLGTRFGMPCG